MYEIDAYQQLNKQRYFSRAVYKFSFRKKE